MGYKDEFEGENVLIKVRDDRDDIINIYTVKGRISDENDNLLVVEKAVIGDHDYYLYEADRVVINKDYIDKIETDDKTNMDDFILELYHKNRMNFDIGIISLLMGLGLGLIIAMVLSL